MVSSCDFPLDRTLCSQGYFEPEAATDLRDISRLMIITLDRRVHPLPAQHEPDPIDCKSELFP